MIIDIIKREMLNKKSGAIKASFQIFLMKQKFSLLAISFLIFLILFIPFTSAARLPTVNQDSNQWGTLLNEFLQREHTPYGNHSNVTVNGSFSVFNSSNLADKFLYIKESSGFVGIGTANPSTELEVNGSGATQIRINSQASNLFSLLSFQEDSTLLFDIIQLNSNFGSTEPETSNSTHIRSRTSIGNIRIFSHFNGDSRSGLIVASNNNIGIGIESPRTKLEVNGTFMVNQSGPTLDGKMGLWANGTHVGVGIKGSNYLFQVGNVSGTDGRSVNLSNVMFVNESSGRVGIGTTNPEVALDFGTSKANIGKIINIYSNAVNGRATGLGLDVGDSTMLIYAGDDSDIAAFGAVNANGDFTERVRITTSGRVGIGTTVPNYLLAVANGSTGNAVNLSSILYINGNTSRVGIGTPTPQYLFQVANSTTDGRSVNLSNVMFVNESSGRVGIGTATPSSRLYVSSPSGPQLIVDNSPGGEVGLSFYRANVERFAILEGADGKLHFADTFAGNRFMSITNIGNVGIGTTAPLVKLEVNGTLMVNQSETTGGKEGKVGLWANGTHVGVGIKGSNYLFQVGNVSGTDGRSVNLSNVMFVNESSGRVGIGTAAPGAKLDVRRSGAGNIASFYADTSEHIRIQANSAGGATGIFSMFNDDLYIGTGAARIRFGDNAFGNVIMAVDRNGGGVAVGTGYTSLTTPSNGMIIQGNVGIGTVQPLTTFEVNGTLMVNQSGPTLDGKMGLWANGTHVGVGIKGSNYLFQVGNVSGTDGRSVNLSNVMFVNESSGRVGIGTTANLVARLIVGAPNDNANTIIATFTDASLNRQAAIINGGIVIGANSVSTRIYEIAGNVISVDGYSGLVLTTSNGDVNVTPGTAGNFMVNLDADNNVNIGTGMNRNTSLFVRGNDGLVGIGTIQPQTTSEVNGTFMVNQSGPTLDGKMGLWANGTHVGVGIKGSNYLFQVGNVSGTDGRSVNLSNVLFVNESSGRVGIRDSEPGYGFDVVADINSDDCFREAGTQVAGTCASDIRLKKNIQPLQGSLNKILQLKPVEFEWKEGIEELGGTIRYVEGRQVGLIAQDVQQVMPHLVKEKNSYLSVEYNLEMQMMLINAMQEQQDLIKTQYTEIQKLTKRILALEEKIK